MTNPFAIAIRYGFFTAEQSPEYEYLYRRVTDERTIYFFKHTDSRTVLEVSV